ncbi:MAG: class I SAM-dependent methyltransferase [Vicinamibacterales bacterium]
MTTSNRDAHFVGSLPTIYEAYLVPLIFEPYAADMASRLASRSPGTVLEIAAGTGVVTRALAATLPKSVAITGTDLNQAMLDEAGSRPIARPVEWRKADAMRLPFDDGVFDAVVCQFGAMFFPDKPKAFSEARRVLRPGGLFIFNVWDRIETNEFADVTTKALEPMFPQSPPRFLVRTPHGYHDRQAIERDVKQGGFAAAELVTVAARSRAESPQAPAIGYCQGTPLRNEIEAHGPALLERATGVAAEAIAARFGQGAVDGGIQAIVVTAEK